MQCGYSRSWGLLTMTIDRKEFSGLGDQLSTKCSLVLAVDDDDDNLCLLSYTLELLNCEFIGTTDGRTALETAKERQPDLILTDIMLPDISGIELLDQLKQDSRTRHIPVIAITGLALLEDRAELLSKGFVDYLSKPYMVDELEAMVRHHLHQTASCS